MLRIYEWQLALKEKCSDIKNPNHKIILIRGNQQNPEKYEVSCCKLSWMMEIAVFSKSSLEETE